MNNKLLGAKFAQEFNKKYGIITYSGTLAIETALISLKLKKGSKVLVLSEVCYSIVNTILKLDLIPVIIIPENGLSLTNNDIDKILIKENIDCILLVHQYGILNDIDLKKYKEKDIKIIEDVAQIWNTNDSNYSIGKYSDIVVTSFGKTKPLSYGIGGGLFFDENSIFDNIDYYDNNSREKNTILLSYTYPLCENIEYEKLKSNADNIVKEQRRNSNKYYEILKENSSIKCIDYDNKHAFHRFPIWVDNYEVYHKIVNKIKNTDLEYQLLHEVSLIDLERNINCIKYNNQNQSKYVILLRTRNVNIQKQLEILKIITKI